VRKGSQVGVSWNVTGLVSANTCQITATPSLSGFPQTWNKTGTSWVSNVSATIQQQTIFALRCSAPDGSQTSTSKTVTILPEYQEI
jgi:V8-like Glu-specific endopeptidase